MGKIGIKVKRLAAELGITSRQLLERCRAEGLPVQNSISKVPPEVERLIRTWFAVDETSAGPAGRPEGDSQLSPGRG